MSDKIRIDLKQIPQHDIDLLARPLINIVAEFFNNSANQKKYEEWHYKKYGRYPTEASYMNKGAALSVAQI